MFNSGADAVGFTIPAATPGAQWVRVVDTVDTQPSPARFESWAAYPLEGRSVAVLRMVGADDPTHEIGQGGPRDGR